MPTTNMTCKATEASATLERIVRQWHGTPLEVRVSPQADGLCVLTIQTPSGVEVPSDPGPSVHEANATDLQQQVLDWQAKLVAMTGARDASDAEMQRVKDDLSEQIAVLRAQLDAKAQ